MKESQVAGVLTPVLAQFGLELEAVEIIPAGKRRLVRVVVDGDGPDGTGPLLDEIAEASKAASGRSSSGCRRARGRVAGGLPEVIAGAKLVAATASEPHNKASVPVACNAAVR